MVTDGPAGPDRARADDVPPDRADGHIPASGGDDLEAAAPGADGAPAAASDADRPLEPTGGEHQPPDDASSEPSPAGRAVGRAPVRPGPAPQPADDLTPVTPARGPADRIRAVVKPVTEQRRTRFATRNGQVPPVRPPDPITPFIRPPGPRRRRREWPILIAVMIVAGLVMAACCIAGFGIFTSYGPGGR